MAGSGCESGKYLLVGVIGVLLIGNVLGSPLPQQDETSDEWESNNEIDTRTVAPIEEDTEPIQQITSSSTVTKPTTTTSSTTTEPTTTTSTTTTEYPYEALAKAISQPVDKNKNMQYSGGNHRYTVRHGEDDDTRALEEYNYHFVRNEQGLPPTTKRYNFGPPRKY